MAKTRTPEGKLNWETKAALGAVAVALAACGYLGLREAAESESPDLPETNPRAGEVIDAGIFGQDQIFFTNMFAPQGLRVTGVTEVLPIPAETGSDYRGVQIVGVETRDNQHFTYILTEDQAGKVTQNFAVWLGDGGDSAQVTAYKLKFDPESNSYQLQTADGERVVMGSGRINPASGELWQAALVLPDGEIVQADRHWLDQLLGVRVAEAAEEETATATLTPTPSLTWTPMPTVTATVELTPTATATLKEVEPKSVCGNSPLRPLTGFLWREDNRGLELAKVRFCLIGEPRIVTEAIVLASGTEVQAQTVVAKVRIFATDGSGGYRDYLIGLRDKAESGETNYIAFIQGHHYYPMTTDMTKVRDYLSQVLQVNWSRQISLRIFISSDESNPIRAVSEPDKEFALALMDALENNQPLPEQPEGVYIRGDDIEFPSGVQIDE